MKSSQKLVLEINIDYIWANRVRLRTLNMNHRGLVVLNKSGLNSLVLTIEALKQGARNQKIIQGSRTASEIVLDPALLQ